MPVLVSDTSLIKPKQEAPKEIDKQAELLTAFIDSQSKTEAALLFIGQQLANIKEQNNTEDILLYIGKQLII